MERAIFLKLLTKKLDSGLSIEEEAQFEAALADSTLQQMAAMLEKKGQYEASAIVTDLKLKEVWKTIAQREHATDSPAKIIKRSDKPLSGYNWLKIAAVILLFISAGLYLYTAKQTTADPMLTASATGKATFLTLADGTKVWLSKHASIRYNNNFGKQKRTILLSGDAFFDVAENEKVPLSVISGSLQINVKGTAFNVQSIPNKKRVEVTLLRGLVEIVEINNPSKKILLQPNYKLVYDYKQAGSLFSVTALDALKVPVISTLQDSLVFKKEKLKDLAIMLEGRYKTRIDIQDDQLKEKRFTGSVTNETLKQVLEGLKHSYPFQYQITSEKVTIYAAEGP
ncbi:MAG: FecR family protein [Pedobacter sp.]|nr:MAG: FecR family protein [Pedobacter sp.]